MCVYFRHDLFYDAFEQKNIDGHFHKMSGF